MHSVANASPARGWANNDIVKCMRQSDQDENYFCEMVYGVADHVEALDTIINEALELTRAYADAPPAWFYQWRIRQSRQTTTPRRSEEEIILSSYEKSLSLMTAGFLFFSLSSSLS